MENKKTVAILVARMGSSRMPGKSMADIMGKPMVWYIIDRLKKMNLFDEICLATSDHPRDQVLADLAKESGISWFQGDQEDVLSRAYHAAKHCQADVIVEIGGDCPFVDKEITKRALTELNQKNLDFVSNVHKQTYPDGIDIYALTFETLEKAHHKAIISSQRLHPFSYVHKHPDEFKTFHFEHTENLSKMRWTLDYEEDFQFVKAVIEALWTEEGLFSFEDILNYIKEKPEVGELNKKWVMDHPETGDIPVYWYTKAYINDMLNDVKSLSIKCQDLEKSENYKEARHYYSELKSLVEELYERAEVFSKN